MDNNVDSQNEQRMELEIEYKAMLDAKRYEDLLELFAKFADRVASYTQTNYYFDTEDNLLINQGITVRLRNVGESWVFQVKIPKDCEGEYNEQVEFVTAVPVLLAGDFIKNGIVKYNQLLQKISVLNQYDGESLHMVGSLATVRQDYDFYTDKISLDKSSYLDVVDYELEWETTNHHFVPYMFNHLDLKPVKSVGKITRFLDRLNRQKL